MGPVIEIEVSVGADREAEVIKLHCTATVEQSRYNDKYRFLNGE